MEQRIQQGWQCPICKSVYAPSNMICWYCLQKVPFVSIKCEMCGRYYPANTVGHQCENIPSPYTKCPVCGDSYLKSTVHHCPARI